MPILRNPLPRALPRASPLIALNLRSGISQQANPGWWTHDISCLGRKGNSFLPNFWFFVGRTGPLAEFPSDFVQRCFTVGQPRYILPTHDSEPILSAARFRACA